MVVCGGQNKRNGEESVRFPIKLAIRRQLGKGNEGFQKVNRLKAQCGEDGEESRKSAEGGFEKKEIEEILAERS